MKSGIFSLVMIGVFAVSFSARAGAPPEESVFQITGTGFGRCADHFGDAGSDDAFRDAGNRASKVCEGLLALRLDEGKSEVFDLGGGNCQTKFTASYKCTAW